MFLNFIPLSTDYMPKKDHLVVVFLNEMYYFLTFMIVKIINKLKDENDRSNY